MNALQRVMIGQEIRRRRLALGWTLEQFAEACSITPYSLGMIEVGKREVPTVTLIAFARYLKCSPGELTGQPDKPFSPAALMVGKMLDKATKQAQDAAISLLRVLVTTFEKEQDDTREEDKSKPDNPDDEGTISSSKPNNGLPS